MIITHLGVTFSAALKQTATHEHKHTGSGQGYSLSEMQVAYMHTSRNTLNILHNVYRTPSHPSNWVRQKHLLFTETTSQLLKNMAQSVCPKPSFIHIHMYIYAHVHTHTHAHRQLPQPDSSLGWIVSRKSGALKNLTSTRTSTGATNNNEAWGSEGSSDPFRDHSLTQGTNPNYPTQERHYQ